MGKHTPAFLAMFAAHAKALFTPARGRHAARRCRSTRVRPYAPVPSPVQVSAPLPMPEPSVRTRRPVPPAAVRPSAPRLAPPVEHPSADDIALVRPHHTSYERDLTSDLDRVQTEATARLQAWVPKPTPAGDLLAAPVTPEPGEFDELASLVRTWQSQRACQRSEVVA